LDFNSSSVYKRGRLPFFKKEYKTLNNNAARYLVNALEGICQNFPELRANTLWTSERTAAYCCGKNKPQASSSPEFFTVLC
jgi:hypothetical protein